MSAVNFNTSNQTLRQLLGNGLTYRVPRFQRDYSWTEDEWEALWQDAIATVEEKEPAHYLGYLVLQSGDSRRFEVIDGQQRLTTLSVLILAVLKNLLGLAEAGDHSDRNRQRVEQLRQSFIGYLDPVTLTPRSKLSLNRVDDPYYQSHLIPLGHLPQRKITASQRRLFGAFTWFVDRTKKWVSEKDVERKPDPDRRGVLYAELVDRLADRLFFTVITVTDELNAFKVFETLNARGVKLSPTDLLKNYLFSEVHRDQGTDEDISHLEERWQRLVAGLEDDDFPDFLRTHWNSRFPAVRHAELFKTIRAKVTGRGAAFELIRALEADLETYKALSDPHAPGWTEKQRESIGELRMFSVRQPYSLLLACRRKLTDDELMRVLRVCVVISFRWNVIGALATGEQERAYHAAAQAVESGEAMSAKSVFQRLRPIYVTDETFRKQFEEKVLTTVSSRNRKVVKYILAKLEQHVSQREFDFESDSCSIEHILPEKPSPAWDADFTTDQIERFVNRIGNLALIRAKENWALGNASYPEKRGTLSQSEFLLTSDIPTHAEVWTPDQIAERQRRLAKYATSVWRYE